MEYLRVVKPWLVLANLVTAAAGFLFAAREPFAAGTFAAALCGIALFVACGCVCNNWLDRDMDRTMARTRERALATGALSPRAAFLSALGLGMAGVIVLLAGTNGLTLALVLAGLAVYVVVYTAWLKRRSPWSTVVGSLAGAAPPLAGYCAAAGAFDVGAALLLAIFSLWQIPHSYAITELRRDDYAAAGVPVLPVRYGVAATKRHLFRHTLAFAGAALLPPVFGLAGPVYAVGALLLGVGWIVLARRWLALERADETRFAKILYVYSIVAVVALSVLLAADAVRAAPLS